MSKPIKTIKCGQVECAIWQGEYQGKPTFSFTFQKSYKKGDKWEHTGYFGDRELMAIPYLIDEVMRMKIAKQNAAKTAYAPPKSAAPAMQPVDEEVYDLTPDSVGDENPF